MPTYFKNHHKNKVKFEKKSKAVKSKKSTDFYTYDFFKGIVLITFKKDYPIILYYQFILVILLTSGSRK